MDESKEQPAADLFERGRDPDAWSQLADQVRAQWSAAADSLGDAMCQAGRQIQRTAHVSNGGTNGTPAFAPLTTSKRAQRQLAATAGSIGGTVSRTSRLAQARVGLALGALAGLLSTPGRTRRSRQRQMNTAFARITGRTGLGRQPMRAGLTKTLNKTSRQARKQWANTADDLSHALSGAGKLAQEQAETLTDTVGGALNDAGKLVQRRTNESQRQARKTLMRAARSLLFARLGAQAVRPLVRMRARRRRVQARGLGFSPAWLWAAGLGASLMYFFDPDAGGRRRAQLRDQMIHFGRTAGDALSRSQRDLGNRMRGLAGETRLAMSDVPVPDHVLAERVRAQLGGVVVNPGSIGVTAHQGLVTLSGPVLTQEENHLLARVHAVPGVTGIENRLETHDQPGSVPGLQGGAGPGFDQPRGGWAPGFRVLAGLAGGMLAVTGISAGGFFGAASGAVGLGLLALGITRRPARQAWEQADTPTSFEVHKTITVQAPVHEVFSFWRHFENFPQFMSHVIEVQDLGDNRSHWTVEGPAGSHVSWNARMTRMVSNAQIAWQSEPGATVRNAGSVTFTALPQGGTQVDVHMTYSPPAGMLGQTVAAFFGSDPKREMDDDLARFQSLIESGKTSTGDRTVTREQVQGD